MTTQRFDSSDRLVGAARAFVAGVIVDLPAAVRDPVVLMVSELATNALVHADGGFDVSVDRSATAVFVAVSDRGGGTPVIQSPPTSESHGRGLQIVEALSDGWGASSEPSVRPGGTTVWFRKPVVPSDLTPA